MKRRSGVVKTIKGDALGEQVERWVPFHLRDTPLLAVEAEAETEAEAVSAVPVAAAEKEEGDPSIISDGHAFETAASPPHEKVRGNAEMGVETGSHKHKQKPGKMQKKPGKMKVASERQRHMKEETAADKVRLPLLTPQHSKLATLSALREGSRMQRKYRSGELRTDEEKASRHRARHATLGINFRPHEGWHEQEDGRDLPRRRAIMGCTAVVSMDVHFVGKTYAHLSLHCALSHFRSHASVPADSVRNSAAAFAIPDLRRRSDPASEYSGTSSTEALSWRSRTSLPKSFRPLLLDPIFSEAAPPIGPPNLSASAEPRKATPLNSNEAVETMSELEGHQVLVITRRKGAKECNENRIIFSFHLLPPPMFVSLKWRWA